MTDGVDLAPFDALYRAADDPWSTDTRWYEARKRALLMASLHERRYGTAYEAGCGNGNLSVLLAERCDRLLASDGSDEALRVARSRLAGMPQVTVAHHVLPAQWPEDAFDLIVLSEVLYFLHAADIERVASLARASAGAGGLVVACNWRAEIAHYGHTGADAHRRFEAALDRPRLFHYDDDDFVLSGWSADARSVAVRERVR